MPIKGVIFDFDGTFANTLADLTDAVNVGLHRFGYPHRPASEVRLWIGSGLPTLCRLAIAAGNPPVTVPPGETHIQQMAAVVTEYYLEHRLDKTRPYPGIPAVLDALMDARVSMAVLSNKPHVHTAPMVEALFGERPWTAIEGCRDDDQRKPDPQTARTIMARMRLEPGQVMMVGDSAVDVQTGLNAGMVTVGVTWGFRDRAELIDAGAHHIIDRPEDLLALI